MSIRDQLSYLSVLAATLVVSLVACTPIPQKTPDVGVSPIPAGNGIVKHAPMSWPFQKWSSAKAYTFNFFTIKRGVPLYVYTNHDGWSPHIRSEMEISIEQSARAAFWVNETKGSIDASKCPFPRHAVVFFDAKGKPIASVNICFECGDILVWPPYYKDIRDCNAKYDEIDPQTEEPKILKVYDRVYPLWMDFFQNELRMPIDWQKN
jgi:hypothetical protein